MKKYCLTLLVVLCTKLSAVDVPNLSGTWTLNVAQSSFAKEYAQGHITITLEITHQDPVFKMHSIMHAGPRSQVQSESWYEVTTDGKDGSASTRIVMPGAFGKTKDKVSKGAAEAHWDQRDLILGVTDGGNSSKQTIKLDPLSGQLITETVVAFGSRSQQVRFVYDKQP